jgi:glycosyltransferase involved in cell wall biosynthesis
MKTTQKPRVAFVHNYATHYNERTFRLLAQQLDIRFYFYSHGQERYWLPQHGVRNNLVPGVKHLPGFSVGHTRITPTLPTELLSGDFDAIVSGINGRFALPVAALCARVAEIPFVLWTGLWAWPDTPLHRVARPALVSLCKRADSIVVYGKHVRDFLVDQGAAAPGRIFIEPHAVDNESCGRFFSADEIARERARLGGGDGSPLILFVGRLEPEKGVADLLVALSQIRAKPRLAIAGTGSDERRLRRLSEQLGVATQVTFLGYVPTGETPALYAAADVLAVPSVTTARFKEPWGLVVNEAFNQSLPAVVSEAVGAAAGGLVLHERTGLVVPERRPDLLGKALDRVIHDVELRLRLSANAKRQVAHYTQEAVANTFVRAIEYALATPRRKTFARSSQ